jgi:hypothetical protein
VCERFRHRIDLHGKRGKSSAFEIQRPWFTCNAGITFLGAELSHSGPSIRACRLLSLLVIFFASPFSIPCLFRAQQGFLLTVAGFKPLDGYLMALHLFPSFTGITFERLNMWPSLDCFCGWGGYIKMGLHNGD